jgi:hypothetical protein
MNKIVVYLIFFLLGEASSVGMDLWRNWLQIHGIAKVKEIQIAKAVDDVEARARATLMHRAGNSRIVVHQITCYPLAETVFPAQLAENSNVTTIAGLRVFARDALKSSRQLGSDAGPCRGLRKSWGRS